MSNTYAYFERTSGTEHNNAADFNQLNKSIAAVVSTSGTAAPIEALDQKFSISNVLNVSSTATDKVYSSNYIEDNFSSGGGGGVFMVHKEAAQFNYPTSVDTPAVLSSRIVTNIERSYQNFDNASVTTVLFSFYSPKTLTGNINIVLTGVAATAHATNNEVQFRLAYANVGITNDLDSASFTNLDSGDYACGNVQNGFERILWNDTAANMGLDTFQRKVYCKLQRISIDAGAALASFFEVDNITIYGDYA